MCMYNFKTQRANISDFIRTKDFLTKWKNLGLWEVDSNSRNIFELFFHIYHGIDLCLVFGCVQVFVKLGNPHTYSVGGGYLC